MSSEHCKYFPSPNTTWYHLETAWIKIGHHLGTTWTTHEHLKPLQLQEYQMGGRRLYKLGYCSVCWKMFVTAVAAKLGTTWKHLGDSFETSDWQLWENWIELWDKLWTMMMTLRQLWVNFGTTPAHIQIALVFGTFSYNFEMILRQLWDMCDTSFGLFWDNSQTTLRQLISDSWQSVSLPCRQHMVMHMVLSMCS